MPDVCAQHLVAIAIVDGMVTFDSTHDHARMSDPAVLAIRQKTDLLPSAELTIARPARQAIVQIVTSKGTYQHHARAVRGTPENPMTIAEIEAKALDLVGPIIGVQRGQRLVATCRNLASLKSMRDLKPLLVA
jgi:2-methylcitrate dehydratase PrpD